MNILNILKDKPKGTKLYSPICGECELSYVDEPSTIKVKIKNHIADEIKALYFISFNSEGKYEFDFKDSSSERECLLFPSNEMRDWNKYLWKKGDVLTDGYRFCIFDHFKNDRYNLFVCKFKTGNIIRNIEITQDTESWVKATNKNKQIDDYIKEIEHKYNGKLNLETLEIEKEKHEFKPFDRVLIRDNDYDGWNIDLFEYLAKGTTHPYRCLRSVWKQCIPYEGNEHLLNTSNNPTE